TRVQTAPSVASNGVTFFVAWSDSRNGTPDIFGTRVDTSGAVLDPAGVAISVAAGSQVAPSVASDGTGYLVAWQDGRSGTAHVYAARVAGSGAVLDGAGIGVHTSGPQDDPPRAVFGG